MLRLIESVMIRLVSRPRIAAAIRQALMGQPAIFGDPGWVTIAPSAIVQNALFNVSSGRIVLEDDVMFGHNVSLITGTHDYSVFGSARITKIPPAGRDIIVERSVWIASNATILGPARIGAYAVVAAGSVVIGDVAPYTLVAGIPAKFKRMIDHDAKPSSGARESSLTE